MLPSYITPEEHKKRLKSRKEYKKAYMKEYNRKYYLRVTKEKRKGFFINGVYVPK